MQTFDDLERAWDTAAAPPKDRGRVRVIGVRIGGDQHLAPAEVRVTVDGGVVGDRWSQDETPERHSQVTLMNATVADLIARGAVAPPGSGDNFFVDLDLSEDNLPVGSRLRLGDAILSVTAEPHRGCSKFAQRFGHDVLRWVNVKHRRPLRLRGVHCEVLGEGLVTVGAQVEVLRTPPGSPQG